MKESMKRILPLAFLFALLCAPGCRAAEDELRGVWISSVLNLDYPSSPGLTQQQMQGEIDAILDTMEGAGLNAAFFQVRPCADSLYPSKLFPYSAYLTGAQGQSPDGRFDPLAYLVRQAHKRDIQVHAWLNPYRVTQNSPGSLEAGLQQLADWHPARQDPSLVRLWGGNLYFDPGLPAVRDLVVAGAREIAENYQVDGIHLDDYFYPGKDFDDAATFSQYGGGLSLEDFRRQSVDQLIEALSAAVHQARPTAQFGVSPFGIWANASSLEGGSDTSGAQSYFDMYADTRKWVRQGWLDYISPQLYWYSGQPDADFTKLLSWWCDTVSGTNCRLIPGLAAYKAMDADTASPWCGTREIESQLSQLAANPSDGGCIFFRYGTLRDTPALLQAVSKEADPPSPQAPSGKLAVARPDDQIRTPLDATYFCGTSDASQPLTINGQRVATRASDGSWGVLLPLQRGLNTFIIENGGDKIQRRILRFEPTVSQGAGWPSGDTYLPQGEQAPLFLEGRPGASACALFCDTLIPLSPVENGYGAELPLPGGSRDQVTAYGSPLYITERQGFVSVTLAPGGVYQIGKSVGLTYQVKTDLCDLFPQPDASLGSSDVLRAGMQGPAQRVENGYVLAQGAGYLRLSDVTLRAGSGAPIEVLPAGGEVTDDEARIRFSSSESLSALCHYDSGAFTVTFPGASSKFPLSGDLFATASTQIDGDSLLYTFTLKDFTPSGWYFERTKNGAELVIRRKAQPEKQLEGVTILLDAGHGGQQTGATGCDPAQPEKQVNLRMADSLAEKLKQHGAKVKLTREKDSTITLQERYRQSFETMPDLFLSLHCNSAPDDADLTTYTGVTTYCSGSLAQPLAQALAEAAQNTGRAANPAIDDSRLYLCRQNHTTAILLENGYLPNPFEFTSITSDEGIDQLTDALAQAILDYYGAQ